MSKSSSHADEPTVVSDTGLSRAWARIFLRILDVDLGFEPSRAASISDALAEFAAAAVPADPDLDAHASRILASAVSDTGDDACLLAVRIG